MWIISSVLFVIGSLFLIFAFSGKNNNYLNVRTIFKDYYKIFQKCKLQLVALYLSPLFISISIALIKSINVEILSNINVVLSILVSILFAVMSILCSISKQSAPEYNTVLNETITVILFECIVSIITLVFSFIVLFVNEIHGWLGVVTSAIIYYLVLIVILNIFIVMKRLKNLLDNKQ